MVHTFKTIFLLITISIFITNNIFGKINENFSTFEVDNSISPEPGPPQKIKVLDSENKKKPNWINTIRKEFIIVTGTGKTLDAAKDNALMEVKKHIARAVAENIQVQTEMTTKEQMTNNVSNFFQEFEQTTKAQTADLSFLKGISLSKAEDSYWEKVEEGNKVVNFHQHLLYPFKNDELKMLVFAFELADKKLTEEMDEVLNRIDKTIVVEDMERDISILEKLIPKFIDNRKARAEVGIEKIKSRIKSITIVATERALGTIEYELRIGNQTVTTSAKPKVIDVSKCTNISGIEPSGKGWKITFDAKLCYDDPNNKLKVEHSFKSAKTSQEFFFNVNEGKVEVFINAPIVMEAAQQDDTTVKSGKVTFTFTNKFDGEYTIDKIILNYKEELPIIFDNIGKTFSGKGNQTLTVDLPMELNKATYSSKKAPLVDGFIYYTNKADNKQIIYKIYQNKVTTSW